MRYILVIVMLGNISACKGESLGGEMDDPGQEICSSNSYQNLIGTSIAAVTLPRSLDHRIIGPDTMVTQDYVPERVNFIVDKNSIITDVTCG